MQHLFGGTDLRFQRSSRTTNQEKGARNEAHSVRYCRRSCCIVRSIGRECRTTITGCYVT
jgi:hypothetical protein